MTVIWKVVIRTYEEYYPRNVVGKVRKPTGNLMISSVQPRF